MNVFVTGAKGMLGSEIVKEFTRNYSIEAYGHEDADITDRDNIMDLIKGSRPHIVIHCASYTDVDGCEVDPEKAYLVNGIGTRNVAMACGEVEAIMVYISTDYVFNGKKGSPYIEMDAPEPLNIYGKSKLMGEYFVQNLLNRYYIVRTSWLFGEGGRNFVKTVLNIAMERKEGEGLRIVDDQIGSPTYTKDLAKKISELIEKGGWGIYHITNSGQCSWYELSKKILSLSNKHKVMVEPIKSWETGRVARRPVLSTLDNLMLRLENIPLLRKWEDALSEYLEIEGFLEG